MNDRDRQIVEKILSEIAVAGDLLKGISPEDFLCDERTARAVCMTLINIGELVKNLTPELLSLIHISSRIRCLQASCARR